MTRDALEHLIRAAAVVTDTDDLIVIGSQSILGQFPQAPDELLVSNEADMFPRDRPERAALIDGSIGELSPFHEAFGYYAEGVGPQTAILPKGWRDRLIPVHNENTRGAPGWCLELHDLVISKLAAGRDKDRAYARAVARHGLADVPVLIARARGLPEADGLRARVEARVVADFGAPG